MPTEKWWWRCAAAIFGKAWPASWKSGRRDLRGSKSCKRWPPVFAQAVTPGRLRLRVSGCATQSRRKAGGARRDRTADLVIANDALSQLSYGPMLPPRELRKRSTIGVIYNPRQAQVKNGEIADLRVNLAGTSLVCRGWNRYLAGS